MSAYDLIVVCHDDDNDNDASTKNEVDDSHVNKTISCNDTSYYFQNEINSYHRANTYQSLSSLSNDSINKNQLQFHVFLELEVASSSSSSSQANNTISILDRQRQQDKNNSNNTKIRFLIVSNKIVQCISHNNYSTATTTDDTNTTTTFDHNMHALQILYSYLSLGRNSSARYVLVVDDNDNNDNDNINDNNDKTNVIAIAPIDIYLFSSSSINRPSFILVDIDGTITKSNVRGFIWTTLLYELYYKCKYNSNNDDNWYNYYCHDGICEFFSNLEKECNNYQIIYVTNRPITYANPTRHLLYHLRQQKIVLLGNDDNNIPYQHNNKKSWLKKVTTDSTISSSSSSSNIETYSSRTIGLPNGPLIGNSNSISILDILYVDYWYKNAHIIKINIIEKYITYPFLLYHHMNDNNNNISKDRMQYSSKKQEDEKQQQLYYTDNTTTAKNHNRSSSVVLYAAAFGNTLYDIATYDMIGIVWERIYYITKSSIIYCADNNNNRHNKSPSFTDCSRRMNDENTKNTTSLLRHNHVQHYIHLLGTKFANGYKNRSSSTNSSSLFESFLLMKKKTI